MDKFDYNTSSVDGAAGWARMHAEDLGHESDYRDDANYQGDDEEDDGECHCSDPGCPCDGRKRGSL
jgi:hypothetical protein